MKQPTLKCWFSSPLPWYSGGAGLGRRGSHSVVPCPTTPHPRPLSPEYKGEGRITVFLTGIFLLASAFGCTSNTGPPKTKDSTVRIDVPTKKPLRHVIEQPATIEGFLD